MHVKQGNRTWYPTTLPQTRHATSTDLQAQPAENFSGPTKPTPSGEFVWKQAMALLHPLNASRVKDALHIAQAR